MPRYRIVESVVSSRIWEVDAENEDAALAIHDEGNGCPSGELMLVGEEVTDVHFEFIEEIN